jgi:hypothetical protein
MQNKIKLEREKILLPHSTLTHLHALAFKSSPALGDQKTQ